MTSNSKDPLELLICYPALLSNSKDPLELLIGYPALLNIFHELIPRNM